MTRMHWEGTNASERHLRREAEKRIVAMKARLRVLECAEEKRERATERVAVLAERGRRNREVMNEKRDTFRTWQTRSSQFEWGFNKLSLRNVPRYLMSQIREVVPPMLEEMQINIVADTVRVPWSGDMLGNRRAGEALLQFPESLTKAEFIAKFPGLQEIPESRYRGITLRDGIEIKWESHNNRIEFRTRGREYLLELDNVDQIVRLADSLENRLSPVRRGRKRRRAEREEEEHEHST